MTKPLLCLTMVSVALGCMPRLVDGAPVTWYLLNVGFTDGGAATGSFVYDATTDTFGAVAINTTAGSQQAGTGYGVSGLGPLSGADRLQVVEEFPVTPGSTQLLMLGLGTNMTNAGGVIPVLGAGQSFEYTCADALCGSSSNPRSVTSGSISTMLVPLPALTWYLVDVLFSDGGTASGSFTFAPATGQFSNMSITTTPGSQGFGSSYNNSNLGPAASAGSVDALSGSPVVPGTTSRLVFALTTDMAFVPGFIPLQVASSFEGTCADASCGPLSGSRYVVSGGISTAPVVPEPSTILLLGTGGLAFRMLRSNPRRRTSRAFRPDSRPNAL